MNIKGEKDITKYTVCDTKRCLLVPNSIQKSYNTLKLKRCSVKRSQFLSTTRYTCFLYARDTNFVANIIETYYTNV